MSNLYAAVHVMYVTISCVIMRVIDKCAYGNYDVGRRFASSMIVMAAATSAMYGGLTASAWAAPTPSSAWSISAKTQPTNFSAGDSSGNDTYRIVVTNVGSRPTDGSTVTISDALPATVTALTVTGIEYKSHLRSEREDPEWSCSSAPVQCTFEGVVPAEDKLEMDITVETDSGAAGNLENVATVEGGAAAPVSSRIFTRVDNTPAPFAIDEFSFTSTGTDGRPDTRAGGHPYAVTTTLGLTTQVLPSEVGYHQPAENIKDVIVDVPLGLVGNPQAAPRCPVSKLELDATGSTVQCPDDTKIGEVTLDEPAGFASSLFPSVGGQLLTSVSSLYNLTPEDGHPAEFGFNYAGLAVAVLYPSVVHTEAGYMLRVTAPSTPSEFAFNQQLGFVGGFSLTLFGDPAKHNGTGESPFFTNPSDCSGHALNAVVHLDTWTKQGKVDPKGTPDFSDSNWLTATSDLPPVQDCHALQFNPALDLELDNQKAESPTSLLADLKIPQAPSNDASLATPNLKQVTVTLPAGISVSPSSANGLEACSLEQIALNDTDAPTCPDGSKIGTVELETPLLSKPIDGAVYLARQHENPFGSLIALYIVINDPKTGIVIKLPGRVSLDATTGQISSTFDQNPQLPFSDLRLRFKSGARAPLVTPPACGTYTSVSALTPWSSPDSGPPVTVSNSFEATSGCGGEFAPLFVSGTANNQAGEFSPFSVTFTRQDGEQRFAGVTVRTPPGLLGAIKNVQQCAEPQASQGACSTSSLIGHTTTIAGPGPSPFSVGGSVFLTGPYKGAPFGLSIVVHALAGPFDLGNVIVRAAINVDPHTAQIMVTSDPLPTILQGIPLDLRGVNVMIDRPRFISNPTSCQPLVIDGRVISTTGANRAVSAPFQAANCASLPFKPIFVAQTQAKTSKARGTSLHVTVRSEPGQANIQKVKVSLPKQLPSRLTTLQKACVDTVFNANPATCPSESLVGTAIATTPVLAHSLNGPAYLVSHGGAAFPDLVIVLQGEGIVLYLAGNTNIKKGVTTSTFNAVPDAPISRFDLTLPEGSHSVLTANLPLRAKFSMCRQRLSMPTSIVGHNGAVVNRTTRIGITGCKAIKRTIKKSRKSRAKHRSVRSK